MKRYRYLLKNIGILTLGNFGTKLLTFFLVPLYTSILTTEEYGIYDMFQTTIQLLIPFLTLNIFEGVLRFSMDEDVDDQEVLAIGVRIFLKGLLILLPAMLLNAWFNWFPVFNTYAFEFVILYILSAFNGILVGYVRGLAKVSDLAISGVLSSLVMIVLNILFLAVFHWGIDGYFYATILGNVAQTVYLFIRLHLLHDIHLNFKNEELEKKMKDYSIPMIANSVAWWVNNASDRYIVIALCGMAANGVYSVGYKIPSIINMFQTIFNQAWTISAVKDFESSDQSGFFSTTYQMYNCAMVLICAGIIALDFPLSAILYQKGFFEAWKYVPFLTMSLVFGALSGYIGGIFTAVKDSKIFARSTVVGAVANLAGNLILVWAIGPLGAAISTLLSYVIVWVMRLIQVRKYMKLHLTLGRDLLVYGLLVVQSLSLFAIGQQPLQIAVQAVLILAILALFGKQIIQMVKSLSGHKKLKKA